MSSAATRFSQVESAFWCAAGAPSPAPQAPYRRRRRRNFSTSAAPSRLYHHIVPTLPSYVTTTGCLIDFKRGVVAFTFSQHTCWRGRLHATSFLYARARGTPSPSERPPGAVTSRSHSHRIAIRARCKRELERDPKVVRGEEVLLPWQRAMGRLQLAPRLRQRRAALCALGLSRSPKVRAVAPPTSGNTRSRARGPAAWGYTRCAPSPSPL